MSWDTWYCATPRSPGDTHGQLEDVLTIFLAHGTPSSRNRLGNKKLRQASTKKKPLRPRLRKCFFRTHCRSMYAYDIPSDSMRFTRVMIVEHWTSQHKPSNLNRKLSESESHGHPRPIAPQRWQTTSAQEGSLLRECMDGIPSIAKNFGLIMVDYTP